METLQQAWNAVNPLVTFNSDIYDTAHCNVIFEIQFLIFFAICTYHAFTNKNRIYLVSHCTTLMAGIYLDLFTIYSSEIGNFHQHKFMIMILNNCEPLYIFCGLYTTCHFVNILSLNINFHSIITRYSFTLLFSLFNYLQFDFIGIHFQMWSWHNSDQLLIDRNNGVPIASTMFFVFFTSGIFITNQYFNNNIIHQNKPISILKCLLFSLIAGFIAIILMILLFMIIYHPIVDIFGLHSKYALYLLILLIFIGLMTIIFSKSKFKISIQFKRNSTFPLFICYVIICIINGTMMIFINPKHIKQRGYHQPLFNQQENEISFWGLYERNKFVVMNDIVEDRDFYNFKCLSDTELNEINQYFIENEGKENIEGLKWYTLCPVGLSKEWIFNYFIISVTSICLAFMTQCLVFKQKEKSS